MRRVALRDNGDRFIHLVLDAPNTRSQVKDNLV